MRGHLRMTPRAVSEDDIQYLVDELDADLSGAISLDAAFERLDWERKGALHSLELSLDLPLTSTLVKWAIQFGTRIAPCSNRWAFGAAPERGTGAGVGGGGHRYKRRRKKKQERSWIS